MNAPILPDQHPLKQSIARIDARIAELRADTEAAGKNKYGVYVRTHSDEVRQLSDDRNRLFFEYRATEAGINECINEALKRAPIWYSAVHPVSPNSIGLYAQSSSSPSGRYSIGNVENCELAHKILAERGIGRTVSNARANPAR